MSPGSLDVPRRLSPFAATPSLPLVAAGLSGLAAVIALLPFLGDERISFPEQTLSYVIAIIPRVELVHGLLAFLDAHLTTPRLLLLGAVSGAASALSTYLGGRPEDLGILAALPLTLLFLATIALASASILLAMLAGLFLETALPALPFMALSFLAANFTPAFQVFFSQARAALGR